MHIKPIKTDQDYQETLASIHSLMDAKPDTQDGETLDVLVTLIEAYEARHFPIAAPTPIEAIKFRMEQMELNRKDLEPMIGTRSRVSEILSGKRTLTLKMIRKLHQQLNIPADVLLGT